METVILAAGSGTRIRPLSANTPKPMLPVAGKPLVEHTADAAVEAGTERLVFVVGYREEEIRSHFGETYRGTPVRYATQETPQGTADALQAAAPYLDGPFAVLNGDSLYEPADVDELFDVCPAVAATRVATPSNYGVLSTDGGVVTDIVEKPEEPPTDLANAGGYVFPERALEWLDVDESARGERELTDVLARVLDRFDTTPVTLDRWLDVGRPWELLAGNEWKLGELDREIAGEVSETATVRGDVVVEPDATVDSGAVIEGPAMVRSGATVGPNAYVRGATLLGRDVSVGHGVEVKNSVVMAETSVNHLSYVGDSVLGRDVNFGAGTNVANLRHDEAPVEMLVKGETVSTGRRKFGVVAGDGAKTGINTSLAPGVTLSCAATTRPSEYVDKDR
ncbi:bifunctional sugar-1-phosphate nucleotidylyltransferase/acetyltransferase [Halomicrobium urmianum]|uniref:bifunctional sugar-1-phosphate nucleotidylyltransferase/acetyltransferase n=1 Tax=Halomicrobium urmianum TaxID=1586233 RepID=UPI001CD93BC7|nr:bifunctional sugar-1-phosphate nucleotidylyltransferase/acetyltransferase [Halomicrobium urmianum]